MADNSIEMSPTDWVREQTEQILKSGTTEGIYVLGVPVVMLVTTGARTGRRRYLQVMRVEHEGKYAVVASKGGTPENPAWYYNIKAHPRLPLQDGTETKEYLAREVSDPERQEWWQRAVEVYPPTPSTRRRPTG